MRTTPSSRLSRAAGAALLALLTAGLAAPPVADAQASRTRTTRDAPPARASAEALPRGVRSEALSRGGYAIVVDLDANRLYFAKGRQVLWSAPVGTGTGLRLASGRSEWEFSTPTGTYQVIRKEREPDWIAPDWWFVRNGLPVPPMGHPSRRHTRGLGAAAVYIGDGLAIHGTDRPELLGQRVSAGCIRLSDADALRLFHNAQVGTEVVIVGGSGQRASAPPPPPATNRRGPPPRDPYVVELEGHSTNALIDGLSRALVAAAVAPHAESRWPQIASVLLYRGINDDDDRALGALLVRFTDLGPGRLRDEYATFLADAYAQGTLRTLAVLPRLAPDVRAEVSRGIVEATLSLYPGDASHALAPWPTRRAPRDVLRRDAQRGWDVLREAEDAHRRSSGLAVRGG
jgi:lipoprotein-anchoring transpeptidase ErfK/SrfK